MVSFKGWIAVFLATFGSFVTNFGMNLQKLCHTNIKKEVEEEGLEPRSYVADKIWIFGIFMVIFGSVFDFLALGMGRQCVIAPLGSFTLVSNVLLSIPMHGERPNRNVIYATSAIIFGCSISVAFGGEEQGATNMEDVFAVYRTNHFWIYSIGMFIIIFLLWQVVAHLDSLEANKSPDYTDRYKRWHRFSYGCLSGTMGAQNVIFAKSTATLSLLTISNEDNENMFVHIWSYLIIAALCVTIFLQLHWLNAGLKRFSALFIIPIFQAFWMFVAVCGGLYVFDEIDAIDGWGIICFVVGVLVTISGVLYLSILTPESMEDGGYPGSINSHESIQHDFDHELGNFSLMQSDASQPMDYLQFFHHVSEVADAITWGPVSMARLNRDRTLTSIDSDWQYKPRRLSLTSSYSRRSAPSTVNTQSTIDLRNLDRLEREADESTVVTDLSSERGSLAMSPGESARSQAIFESELAQMLRERDQREQEQIIFNYDTI